MKSPDIVTRMADALQSLSMDMLDSGTARWGAYERAGLTNHYSRSDPDRISFPFVHTPLDREAVNLEKARRVAQSGASGALSV
jgi:hypothetical protein